MRSAAGMHRLEARPRSLQDSASPAQRTAHSWGITEEDDRRELPTAELSTSCSWLIGQSLRQCVRQMDEIVQARIPVPDVGGACLKIRSGACLRIGPGAGPQSQNRSWLTFVERNPHRVADHDVTLPSGTTVHNPLRVLAHPDGSEVVFTVRQIELTDEEFDRDCALVADDLARLRAL